MDQVGSIRMLPGRLTGAIDPSSTSGSALDVTTNGNGFAYRQLEGRSG
ncbi:MAG TPA: hypothetical protein VFA81_03260 [Burkholderiales bacterium]|nr:hypothetical protein [Burkholderiales bacterium]